MRAWIVVLAGCCASTEPPFKVGDKPRPPRGYLSGDLPVDRRRDRDHARHLSAARRLSADPVRLHDHVRAPHAPRHPSRRLDRRRAEPRPRRRVLLHRPADPAQASAQINTQPMLPAWWIGKRRITFLILEGEHTTRVADQLLSILEHHEMTER